LLCGAATFLAAAEGETGEAHFRASDFDGSESCEPCHPRQHLEWRGSAHAYSLVDPVFRAMNRMATEEMGTETGNECLQCHGTIGVRSGELQAPAPRDPQELFPNIREGTSCEACHRMEPPDDEAEFVANANFKVTPAKEFFGRLVRPAGNQAHGSAFSAYLGHSASCGACHDVVHGARRIERSFLEWKGAVHSRREIECLDCHMLRFSGQAATEGPFRDTLRRHNFPGVSVPLIRFPNRGYQTEEIQRFLRTAARLSVLAPQAVAAGEMLELPVLVKNSGTAHNLPAASMRQMWIEVTVLDARGGALFRSGHLDANGDLMEHHSALEPEGDAQLVIFRDTHLDDDGNEVPFWRSSQLDEHSLRPLEVRESIYHIPIPAALEQSAIRIRVRLLHRSFPPYGLRKLGLAHLARELPIWEMNVFDSGAVPVVDEVPRRTEYRLPGDFAGVQEAIDALRAGDRLKVAPGEYLLQGPLDFRGKEIELVSREGPGKTVLRLAGSLPAASRESVVVFQSGEGPGARLEGFTIEKGGGTLADGVRRGGGIYIRRSSPTIRRNRIVGCSAPGGAGGGICCEEGSPEISGNEVLSCRAARGGGLAYLGAGDRPLVLRGNLIEGNLADEGGGVYVGGGRMRLDRSVVAGNIARGAGGGAFAADGARLELDHVTFVHNRAWKAHGALRAEWEKQPPIRSSIFWYNRPFSAGAEFRYCLLERQVAAGSTNRNVHPLFVDPGGEWARPLALRSTGDADTPLQQETLQLPAVDPTSPEPRRWYGGNYHLLPGSPAIDAGDPDEPADPDDTRADVGAYFVEQPLKGFVRGDTDGDGNVSWSDLVALLRHLAREGGLACLDAADVDDGGRVDPIDAVLLGAFLLTGKFAPAAPFPACGLDPTFGEGLTCQQEIPPCRREEPGVTAGRGRVYSRPSRRVR
jgi:hypothetical protein